MFCNKAWNKYLIELQAAHAVLYRSLKEWSEREEDEETTTEEDLIKDETSDKEVL